jgi:hypothetical protein
MNKMKTKILHKHKPNELHITQVGKRIIVKTLKELKNELTNNNT